MDYLDEIENQLDEDGRYENAKYKLRQRFESAVIEVVVTEHPNIPGDVLAIFRRGRLTMDNPEYTWIDCVYDPDELVAIAKMALFARDHLLNLSANRKLEHAGQA